jgi:alpha-tubulin suppressor-like RCC1 family protein
MKKLRVGMVVIALAVMLAGGAWWSERHNLAGNGKAIPCGEAAVSPGAAKPVLAQDFGRLPLYFIENRGQVDKRVKYYSRGSGHTTFFTNDGLVLSLARSEAETAEAARQSGPSRRGKFLDRGLPGPRGDIPAAANPPSPLSLLATFLNFFSHQGSTAGGPSAGQDPWPTLAAAGQAAAPGAKMTSPNPVPCSVVRLQPVSMKKNVKVKALEPQEAKVNYFIGSDPKKWRTDIPTYQAVVYEEAYKGIDLKFYGAGRQLEYDVVVKPGADPGQVRFAYEGVKELRVTAAGDLALVLPDGGELLQKKPYVYQEIAGQRVPREAKFRVARDQASLTCGFQVAAYDRTQPLVIDPVLSYSTYLGGGGSFYTGSYDEGSQIAVDSAGNAYITGYTECTNFPTLNPLQSSRKGTADCFVTKLTAAGALSYSTYLGGSDYERPRGIAVDSEANAYITGYTYSTDFPTRNAFQATKKGTPTGSTDAFVTKLTATGALAYSTYLGGSYCCDEGHGIAVDSGGNAYITGYTNSPDFPTLNPLQSSRKGTVDCFVTKLTAAGALAYSTFLGGSDDDNALGIAVDSGGCAYITGWTQSSDFPTRNPFQGAKKGGMDVFITKLTAAGALAYSTFLGGSLEEMGLGIAIDARGNAFITGYTKSADFLTLNPVQAGLHGTQNAFVAKLTPAGALVYSTYLGGSGREDWTGIAADPQENAYITGNTTSSDFPTLNAFQGELKGSVNAFFTKLTSAGALDCSSYLGGSGTDFGRSIALDSHGNAYITGYTTSSDFPTLNAFQGELKGAMDAFVAKLSFPVPMSKVTMAGGERHSLAVKANGRVLAWGEKAKNQCNVPVAAQSGVSAVSAGEFHSLALKADGSVVAWGENGFGQCTVPAAAQSGCAAVSGGGQHSLALKADGSVVAWGDNSYGQRTVPAAAQAGVTAVAAGSLHSLALKDGAVLAWGVTWSGNLTIPAAAQSGVSAVAAGGFHSLALKNGTVLAWGDDQFGLLNVPAAAQSGVVAVAAGYYHSLALTADGRVVAWGENGFGQCTVPAAAQSGVIKIAAGYSHSIALKADGQIVAWGDNEFGQCNVPRVGAITAMLAVLLED